MKKTILIIGLCVIILLALSFFLFQIISGTSWRDNVLGNLFATAIGAVIGIPIALWINSINVKQQEDAVKRKEQTIHIDAEITMLSLIMNEMEDNEKILEHIKKMQREKPNHKISSLHGLKYDLFDAFSNSGEIKNIDDLRLIDNICKTYHSIKRLISLEQRLFQDMGTVVYLHSYVDHISNNEVGNDQSAVENFRSYTLDSIQLSMLAINERIQILQRILELR